MNGEESVGKLAICGKSTTVSVLVMWNERICERTPHLNLRARMLLYSSGFV